MRRLEAKGHLVLPGSRPAGAFGKPADFKRLDAAVALPVDLPDDVSLIEQLELGLVETEADLWM